MLGHLDPGARGNERRRRGNIVGARGIAAGADDVDRVGGRLDRKHLLAHHADRAVDLVNAFATHPQRHQEAADLGGRGVARHHHAKRRAASFRSSA
jgi:hypothetical protein